MKNLVTSTHDLRCLNCIYSKGRKRALVCSHPETDTPEPSPTGVCLKGAWIINLSLAVDYVTASRHVKGQEVTVSIKTDGKGFSDEKNNANILTTTCSSFGE